MALAALLTVCCSRTPGPAGPGPGAEASSNRQAHPAPSAAVATSSAEPSPVLEDGCYSAVDARLGARAKLAALAKHCIAGMAPVLDKPRTFELGEGGKAEAVFAVADPAKCLRAIAAASPSVKELELSILDSQGRSAGEDELRGSFSLVDPHGPICLKLAGSYRAVVRPTSGAGRVAVQLWQSN